MLINLQTIFNNPKEFSYLLTLSENENAELRPLMPDDAIKLAELLTSFSPETRKFYKYDSFDRTTAERLCDEINKYDKLRYVLELTDSKKIIGLFEFSMDLVEDDMQRYKNYGQELEAVTTCRFGPVLADGYQGKGIGKIVFEHLINIAKLFGKKKVILYGGVLEDNEKAIRFYSNVGFQEAGRFVNKDGVKCIDMIYLINF